MLSRGRARLPGRSTLALAVGSGASGVFAYLYIGIGTRAYGAASFAGTAQLWTIWFVTAAVLTFPVQHWAIHRLRSDGDGGSVAAALPRLRLVAMALGLAVVVVTALLRQDLYNSSTLVYPITSGVITVAAIALGLLRGGLAGHDRFVATGLALGMENLVRLAAGLVVIAVGASVHAYGAAIATGVLIIAIWPGAMRFQGREPAAVNPLEFLGSVGGGNAIGQFVLTGGTVVLGLTGGSAAEITSLFAVLALFRAPYVVALGVALRLTAVLTDLVSAGRGDRVTRIRHGLVLGGLALAGAGAAGASLVGPPLLRLVFGDDIDLTGLQCGVVAAGTLLAVATLGLSLVQITTGNGARILRSWLAALGVGAATLGLCPFDPLDDIVVAFLAAEIAAFAFMARPQTDLPVTTA